MDLDGKNKVGRILCVDDSDDVCQLITALLREYDVSCVRGVRQGLAKFNSEEFSLVVLDFQLLDGDGTDFSRAVRELGSTVPIIMITASYRLTDADAAAAGVQKVLRKLNRGFAAELKSTVDGFMRNSTV